MLSRPHARRVLALAAASLVAGVVEPTTPATAVTASGCGSAPVCVVVERDGVPVGDPLDLADIESDPATQPGPIGYPVGDSDDSPTDTVTNVLAIADLLGGRGITDPTFVQVGVGSDPAAASLDAGDLDGSTRFEDGLRPAVWGDETGSGPLIGYIRPRRSDVSDDNSGDVLLQSGLLVIDAHTTGTLLRPTITARTPSGTSVSSNSADTAVHLAAGQSLTFTVDPGDAAAGLTETVSYGDGDSAPAGPYRHRYPSAGFYKASVLVTAPDGSTGQSAAIAITVGTPASPSGGRTGPGGGTASTGPAAGPRHAHPGTSHATLTPKPAATTPSHPATTPAARPAGATHPSAGGAAPAAPTPTPSRRPVPAGGAQRVAGVVIAGAPVSSAAPPPADGPARPTSLRASTRAASATVDRWLLWPLAAVALLIFGALRESRRPSRRLVRHSEP